MSSGKCRPSCLGLNVLTSDRNWLYNHLSQSRGSLSFITVYRKYYWFKHGSSTTAIYSSTKWRQPPWKCVVHRDKNLEMDIVVAEQATDGKAVTRHVDEDYCQMERRLVLFYIVAHYDLLYGHWQALLDQTDSQIVGTAISMISCKMGLTHWSLVYLTRILDKYFSSWLRHCLWNWPQMIATGLSWCLQATSHYLSQCGPSSMAPYGVTRSQWVNGSRRVFTSSSYSVY